MHGAVCGLQLVRVADSIPRIVERTEEALKGHEAHGNTDQPSEEYKNCSTAVQSLLALQKLHDGGSRIWFPMRCQCDEYYLSIAYKQAESALAGIGKPANSKEQHQVPSSTPIVNPSPISTAEAALRVTEELIKHVKPLLPSEKQGDNKSGNRARKGGGQGSTMLNAAQALLSSACKDIEKKQGELGDKISGYYVAEAVQRFHRLAAGVEAAKARVETALKTSGSGRRVGRPYRNT